MPHLHRSKCNLLQAALVGLALAAAIVPAHAAARHSVRAHAAWDHRTSLRSNTPPDSYLQFRVYTVDQLIQQVSTNSTVRARFAGTFGVAPSRLVSYMRNNLVESYIPKTAKYTVYCVRSSGKFYAIRQTFKRGTRVFALRNGEPVMKWICGNPLAHYLPNVQVISYHPAPPKVLVAHNISELTPSEMQHVIVPAEVPAPAYEPMVPVHIAAGSSSVFKGAGVAAAALGAAMVTVASSGHHSGPSPVPTPTPVVPEAPSGAYLLLALPVVAFLARRRSSIRAN